MSDDDRPGTSTLDPGYRLYGVFADQVVIILDRDVARNLLKGFSQGNWVETEIMDKIMDDLKGQGVDVD